MHILCRNILHIQIKRPLQTHSNITQIHQIQYSTQTTKRERERRRKQQHQQKTQIANNFTIRKLLRASPVIVFPFWPPSRGRNISSFVCVPYILHFTTGRTNACVGACVCAPNSVAAVRPKKAANIPFCKRGCESPWGIYFPLRVRKHTKTHSFSNTMHICTLRHSRSE